MFLALNIYLSLMWCRGDEL